MAGKRPFLENEIQCLLKNGFVGEFALRNRAIFAMGITTGYRIKEILHHKVSDVVGKAKRVKNVLYLPPRMRKDHQEGQIKQVMPFAKKALQEYVDELLDGRPDHSVYMDEWLFISRQIDPSTNKAKPISTQRAREMFYKAFDRCEVYEMVSTHSMRKTFAMKTYKKAVRDFRNGDIDIEPLRVVQLHLGHANIANTLKYMSSIFALDMDEKDFDYEL